MMNHRTIIMGIVISLLICCNVFADRQLSRDEILKLFQELTENPRTTWIPAGTVGANYKKFRAAQTTDEDVILDAISQSIEEYQNNPDKIQKSADLQKQALDAIPFNIRYRLSNEYTMEQTIFVTIDGDKYYSDITVTSRKDSVALPDELKGNEMTEEYNLDWNGRNIFCYDGQTNTIYTPSINHAMIDAGGVVPQSSKSVLSKGIIPWGYRYFNYENLSETDFSAVETIIDGKIQIQLTLNNPNGSQLQIDLDPEKEYAVSSWVITDKDNVTIQQYSDYQLVSGSWVPKKIQIEKFDRQTNELISGDYINITSIKAEVPSASSFKVDFKENALIEYSYNITKPSLVYRYLSQSNPELLKAERLAFMAEEGKNTQNCATASLQYAALQLGKDILNDQLTQLINPQDQTTSLYAMKQYAQSLGFYSKVVTTDIKTLKEMSDCKAILHIPWKNHYVLLDHIDEQYVWIIDLSENKFFYRINISFFDMDWTEGTALLVSNKSIDLPDSAAEISDSELINYLGGTGYTCTKLIQNFYVVYCQNNGNDCYGIGEIYCYRLGCELAASGNCTNSLMYQKGTWPCRNDPFSQYDCTVYDDEMEVYYMWACY